MAQFDVHATQGRLRERAPYVVVIQSARFDRVLTRLVAPLVILRADATEVTPRLEVEGRAVFLDPLRIFAMPAISLGRKVASLADDDSSARIIAAIDEVLSRAFG